MDFVRALKYAVVAGIVVAGVWLFREDNLCRTEIHRRLGATESIHHPLGSTNYDVIPTAWKNAWRAGEPPPVVVSCWTDLGGVSEYVQH